jgi:methionyl-tRNA formyltransferase
VRIVFAGTPEFAAATLEALLAAGHHLSLVLTQPARRAGRGLAVTGGAVQALAQRRGLALYQPTTLNMPEAVERIAAAAPEILVVAAYGLILPQTVLTLAPRGAINVHASLLPRWRGAAPVQRAILAGDRVTGVTIMQMDAGLDTGPILLQRPLAIAADDDAQTLHDRLAALGAALVVEALAALAAGQLRAVPQTEAGACRAPKIRPEEATLDWSLAAAVLERAVRAFCPVPGTQTWLRGAPLKVWRARLAAGGGEPGVVLKADADGLRIACGEGALDLLEVQRAGGRRLRAEAFLRGFAVRPGERLGAAR